MSFEAPLLLLGLLAVAAPILVHLINRQRAARVRFPALEFLARSNKRLARRLKVKQWALLASRIAFFVLVPLAMARPHLACGGAGGEAGSGGRLPVQVVFVLDDSGSMSARAERGSGAGPSVWDEAVERLERELRDLRPWDQAAVLVASTAPRAIVPEFGDDRGGAARAAQAYAPRFGGTDLRAALSMAREVHAAGRLPVRRTVVLTDGGRAGWPDDPASLTLDGLGTLEVIALDGADHNVAVTELNYRRAESGAAGEYVLEAGLRAWGGEPRSVEVTLLVDGAAVGRTMAELEADGETTVPFVHVLEGPGPFEATVRVSGPTGARVDDARTVALQPERAVNVLLANGDPRSVSLNDEVFFANRALDLAIGERREIVPTVVGADVLATVDLSAFDVVVLANPSALPVPVVEQLTAFVERGGGLLLSAGDNVDAERWNSLFGALLPKPLRSVRALATPGSPDASIQATRVTEVDMQHPAVRVFALRGGESIRSALVYRYVLLEPSPDSAAETLITFADGGPALVERALGTGRVMLWTTSLDLDWTDMPLATAYVPLVRRLVEYLARRSGSAADEAELGQRVVLPVGALRPERVAITAPDGARTSLDVSGDTVEFVAEQLGVHTVEVRVGGADVRAPELDFAVNAVATEFDPVAVPEELVASLVARAEAESGQTSGPGEHRGRSVWPTLLLLGLLALYLESLLAVRRRFWAVLVARLRGRRREAAL